MTLVILAHHFLVRLRQRLLAANASPPAAAAPAGREGASQRQETAVRPAGAPWPPLAVLPVSLRTVRFLLQVTLPQPVLALPAALALLAYLHQRQVAAYRSHRERLLTHLARPG
jgi:hypothetical protein